MVEKVYSLRELVPEIYNVNPKDSKAIDAHYKELNRVDKAFRSLSDVPDSKGIIESCKDNFVNLMRAIIFSHDAKKILRKVSQKKEITLEEHMLLQSIILENMGKEQERLESKISKYNEFYERIETIDGRMTKLLSFITEYFDEESLFLTDEIFSECEKRINLILDNFEKEVKELEEYTMNKVKDVDSIDDMIYEEKITKVTLSTVESSKHKHLINKFKKNRTGKQKK
ncbi:hypothetical protein ACV3XI_12695 [Clostridium perfringens]|uniref:Uncharacterized protein n=1 Tax=Clostridium perfringens TaxID=1502 RepID=A0AAW9I919_CLOPF|nr:MULTISPECIES: hypothetical protein [Clostridiaceae]MBI6042529.1 hypothetical protein [Clostridium perfringens]MBU5322784.1 hypothetical protein [Sarcina ventriculi]MDM0498343.1 hypothetical protein [Clostridium perfringens]MDM0611602.1 hypothetical protein [Clostridium perfringens]MDM0991275.1 hypothetical protein [Clostridium perfringens]